MTQFIIRTLSNYFFYKRGSMGENKKQSTKIYDHDEIQRSANSYSSLFICILLFFRIQMMVTARNMGVGHLIKDKYGIKQIYKYRLNCHLLKLLSSMQSTFLPLPSSDRTRRNSSLPAKIKIRTCRLPKDFFSKIESQIQKTKSGCESRGSTCDQQNGQPPTPSFKHINREMSSFEPTSRKAQTMRVIPLDRIAKTSSQRQNNLSIRRKISRQIQDKFPLLCLPPLISSKLCIDL